jgi:YVTN family beta-propeller protein
VLVLGVLLAIGVSTVASARASRSPDRLPLTHVTDVPLPGNASRFDYQSIDPNRRRLYLAHLGDSTLDVVDLETLRVVATVPKVAHIHGVAAVPSAGRVYATATGTNELVTIDADTNAVLARTPTGDFPDGVTYDEADALVLVSNKNDGSITIIDASTNSVVATIEVADETGNVVDDATTGTVYATARTPDELVAIDPVMRRITRRIRLPGCVGAHGVSLDTATQRAFVACEHNARLVTVDLHRSRETVNASVGVSPDVLAFDVGLQRLYVASESGTVTAFDLSTSVPRKIGQAHLADAAHTVAVDRTTHRVYFPLQEAHGLPVLRVMAPNAS